MSRSFLYFLLALIACSNVYAQNEGFPVEKIPAELKKHANAIVREYHLETTVASPDEAHITIHYAVTVLNEKGNKYAVFSEMYNKLINVQSARGWLYNSEGKVTAKIKKPEFKDVAPYSNEGFNDCRYMVNDFQCTTYPYTVEYEFTEKTQSALIIPSWSPQTGYDCSIQNADVEVTYPKDLKIRYRTYGTNTSPVASTDNDENKLTLSVSNVSARAKSEEMSPHQDFSGPTLIFVPTRFTMDGTDAAFNDWKDFGKFFYDINGGRDSLPDAMKKTVHQLSDTCTSPWSKINVLYQYLQKNKRYVNVSLGVGGMQEWDATYVCNKGYGDCKALSNFMKALLQEAGISSYQVLVYGGVNPPKLESDFARNIFNHVILCVPFKNDTTWIDCTSAFNPTGYLGTFTEGRSALMITPEGGYTLITPTYSVSDNTLIRKATLTVDDKSNIVGNISISGKGWWWEQAHEKLNGPKSEVLDILNSELSLPNYTVDNYKIDERSAKNIPFFTENVKLHGLINISRTKDEVFLTPRVVKFSVPTPDEIEERSDSFQLKQNIAVLDTTEVSLSGSYIMTQIPQDIVLDYTFASYHTHAILRDSNTVVIYTSFTQKKGVYPPSLFDDYIKLCRIINTATAYSKIALKKNS